MPMVAGTLNSNKMQYFAWIENFSQFNRKKYWKILIRITFFGILLLEAITIQSAEIKKRSLTFFLSFNAITIAFLN